MVNFIKAWLSRCDEPEDFGVMPTPEKPKKEKKVYKRDSLPDTYPEDWDITVRFPKPDINDYPTFGEYMLRDQHFHELETERNSRVFAERRKKAEADLEIIKVTDEKNRVAARSYVPDIKIVRYAAGDFLLFNGKEMPRAFITDIEIVTPGEAPKLEMNFALYGMMVFVTHPDARIKITLSSRKEFTFSCNRWVVDQLHAALLHAWKHGVAVEENAHG